MFKNIEFVDRYGGNLPSTLRACWPCEGMGWHPGLTYEGEFVRCMRCLGTGRISWWATVVRVPAWIVKSIKFIWWATRDGINPPEWSLWKSFRIAVSCSFGADLRRLFR